MNTLCPVYVKILAETLTTLPDSIMPILQIRKLSFLEIQRQSMPSYYLSRTRFSNWLHHLLLTQPWANPRSLQASFPSEKMRVTALPRPLQRWPEYVTSKTNQERQLLLLTQQRVKPGRESDRMSFHTVSWDTLFSNVGWCNTELCFPSKVWLAGCQWITSFMLSGEIQLGRPGSHPALS